MANYHNINNLFRNIEIVIISNNIGVEWSGSNKTKIIFLASKVVRFPKVQYEERERMYEGDAFLFDGKCLIFYFSFISRDTLR